jgi:hypothetical protein
VLNPDRRAEATIRPRRLRFARLMFGVLLLAGGSPPAAGAEPVVIDFEDYTANGPGQGATAPVSDFYADRGVSFNAVTVLDFEQGLAQPGFAHSGSQVVEPCYSQEFCAQPVSMQFRQGQVRVGVWVGLDGSGSGAVVLLAYDAAGSIIDEDKLDIDAGPISVANQMEVTSGTGDIRRAEVRWSNPDQATNGLAVDDVTFEPAAPSLELEPEAIDFGTVARGTDAVRREATIVNRGNTTVQVESVLLDGSAGFVAGEGCDGAVLASGEGCTLTIEFRPSEVGVQRARLEVTGSFGRSVDALVAGTVVGGPVSPSPSASGTTGGGGTDHTTTPPAGAAWEEAGSPVVLLGVLLLAGILVFLPRLRSRGRVRGEPPSGRVSLVPGARYQEIASPAWVVVVSLGLDPSTGTSQWTQGS